MCLARIQGHHVTQRSGCEEVTHRLVDSVHQPILCGPIALRLAHCRRHATGCDRCPDSGPPRLLDGHHRGIQRPHALRPRPRSPPVRPPFRLRRRWPRQPPRIPMPVPTGWGPGCCRSGPTSSAWCSRRPPRCRTGSSRPSIFWPPPTDELSLDNRADTARCVGSFQLGPDALLEELSYLTMSHFGFDQRFHTGEMIVNAAVGEQVVEIFRRLHEARVPDRADARDHQRGDRCPSHRRLNDTTSFVCRPAGQLLDLVTACLRHGDRHQPLPQPYVKGRPGPARTRFGLRRPRRRAGRDDRAWRCRHGGLRRDRLGLGRALELAEGLMHFRSAAAELSRDRRSAPLPPRR